ncbi:DNA mismatch repair endonuclease MutL [Lactobacillus psittaci]|uniref:DNA mismatch repair protein MutL n=1 Tax=Lactobacillus psittaci DSM 15354 TaxID=1122152 RepID=A0A0R1S345_9LACO|nr:DNA mismatch repair endonuclease MutL [Lactobacillus psittaci]KRL63065.1 DNA mismatch repair protein mutL [Lactobacillus psittaci DSM 15354]
MAKIHELSENLTNQIAAGEVIERPASVVKELVENAIDAGSSQIEVEFFDAGLKKIVVSDNGSGIAADELDLAFKRHATSKIATERDLFKIATLGFRGEALASIVAVSHTEVVTSSDGISAVKAEFAGGQKLSSETSAGTKGTKISVSDLFYNTPARLKYLKSPRTETMKIVDIVNRIALGHSDISFTLKNEGKILLKTVGNGNLRQDLANIYGRFIAQDMLEVKQADPDFTLTGLISKPETTRSSRNFISILLNGRYIKNFQLNKAILAGYGSKIATGRYPIVVLEIKLDPLLVDVNVHPTKEQVRLSKEKELSRLITTAISSTLTSEQTSLSGLDNLTKKPDLQAQLAFNLGKNVVDTSRSYQKETPAPKIAESSSQYVNLNEVREDSRYVLTASWDQNVAAQAKLTPFGQDQAKQDVISAGDEALAHSLPNLTYFGHNSSYIFAGSEGDLYLVDQLAAQRSVLFNEVLTEMEAQDKYSQTLLTPLVLDFGSSDFLKLKDQADTLAKLGIKLEVFGQNSFILAAYPLWMQVQNENTLRTILDEFLNSKDLADLKFNLAKAEVKRRTRKAPKLAAAACQDLLEQLGQLADPFHDPFGQVTLVKFTQTELNRMFKKGE